jgi:hypothetical protein
MNTKKETQKTSPSYNSEVTQEDMDALRKKGLSMDSGDDRLLQNRKKRIDFSGDDLDVPGRNDINLTPSAGITDEENSLFGQGGEQNENLEAPERANMDKSS